MLGPWKVSLKCPSSSSHVSMICSSGPFSVLNSSMENRYRFSTFPLFTETDFFGSISAAGLKYPDRKVLLDLQSWVTVIDGKPRQECKGYWSYHIHSHPQSRGR